MAEERIPNVIELGRRPDKVRYMWIAYTQAEELRSGATWITLRRAIDELDNPVVKVVDIYDDKVILIDDPALFLEHWRPHYFDDQWDIPEVK